MMRMRFRLQLASAILLTGVFAATFAHAQGIAPQAASPPEDPLMDVATGQLGRALILRCLCVADTLQFNAQGHLETAKTHAEDWTLSAVDLQKVQRKGPEGFEFDGLRVAIRWNEDAKEFQRHTSSRPSR